MTADNLQKKLAIDQHSAQAEEFRERYRNNSLSPYSDCFRYSRMRLDGFLNQFIPVNGTGLRLLDVGCGTGDHLQRMADRGFEVAGVDGSADMLANARSLNPNMDLRQSDVDALPFADGEFDVILCVEVLRYLPDSKKCIEEMARVLKPGGVCLVTASPLLSLNGYPLINRLAGALPQKSLVRLKQFFTTSGSLKRLFLDAGFAAADPHGVYFGPVNWAERLTPWALPTGLKAWEPIDRLVADRWLIREFSNMFLVHAVRS